MPSSADSGSEAQAPVARSVGRRRSTDRRPPRRIVTAAYHQYLADWLSGVFARLIRLTGANRFPVPSNLITIMVDVCASWRYIDIISEDIDESINMGPSIDRVSIGVWAVITIDCGLELRVWYLCWSPSSHHRDLGVLPQITVEGVVPFVGSWWY